MNSFPSSSINLTDPSSQSHHFHTFNPKLHHAKQTLYPPFFSSKPLANTILDLTKAEPDLSFQASMTLQSLLLSQLPSQSHDPRLLEAWNHLPSQYTKENKHLFYPPEYFLKSQEAQALLHMSLEAKKEALSPLVKFIQDIENMLNQVKKSTTLKHKDQISDALLRLKAFYSAYQGQVSALISNINQKRMITFLPYDQDLEELRQLLKPKALLFGDVFPEGTTVFRISQETAQTIITEEKTSSIFHQIEQTEMVYSLYRLLDIPIPHKAPIILAEDNGNLHFFEVSEALPDSIPLPENSFEWPENHYKTFCLQVLGTILTTPSNPHFIYDPTKHGPVLENTSSDAAYFNPALSPSIDNTYTVKSGSPLYSLPAMDRPLPDSLRTSLKNLSIDLLLLTWLKDLETKRQHRQQLISACSFHSQDLPEPRNTIPQALIDSLRIKLGLITKACNTNNAEITPQNLLEEVSPTLGAHYKALRSPNPQANLQNPSELELIDPNSSPTIPLQDAFQSIYKAYFKTYPHVLDAFMEKYSERRMMKQLDPQEALRELLLYFEFNINHLQNPRNFVDLWYKGKKAISQDDHDLWDLLFSIVENPEVRWFSTVDKYLPRDWNISPDYQPDDPSEVRGALISKRQLSPELQRDIFDQQKSLLNQPLVRFPRDQSQPPVFYIKKEPELAGYEYAVTLFLRAFGVEGVPFCELLIMKDPKQGLYPVLLMQGVEGDPLDKIWLQNDHIFESLEAHHTQMLILGSMLLNPEDGRASNFVLTENHRRIIPVHNDHVFVPGFITKDSGFIFKSQNRELLNKTILYCLPEMNKPIQESVLKKIINMDIDRLLSPWLAKLLQISENSHHLPSDDVRTRDGKKGIFYRMGFPPKFIENLYLKLHKLQERLATNDNTQLCPFDLLLELEPEVGKAYQEVFLQESTVYDRFTKLTAPLYKSAKGPRYNSLQLLEMLEISPEELVGKHFTPKIGPAEALQTVASCSKIYKKIFCYMNLIKGRMQISVEDAQELQGKTEKEFIEKKFKEKDLQILALKNFNVANFSQVSISEAALKALILPGAKNLTQGALKTLGKSFPNLESLIIGDNQNLKALALEAEDFPNLKHLNVSHCPNLMYLRVESPALEALEIGYDKNLKTVGLATTELKHLDCREEKIEVIYVNKGIKKVEVIGTSVQELEEKMVRIELWRRAIVIEKLLVSSMDEKGTKEVLEMMFPKGIKEGLERILEDK